MKRFYLLIFFLVTVFSVASVSAQEPAPLQITGTVVVIDDTTLDLGGIRVDVSAVADIVFVDGMQITVSGTLEGAVLVAVTVIVEPDAPDVEVTPEATPDVEVTPEVTPIVDITPVIDLGGITIVIEGPVDSINVNVVTIYNFEIELPDNDPRITVIQIGDVLQIRGRYGGHRQSRRNALIITAITFTFVDVDVILIAGEVWRDYGSCAVVPPVWADAFAIHWHNRCDVIIISPGVPSDCRVTGMGGVRCSNRGSGMRGSR